MLLRLHWFNPRYRAGWIVKIVDYECCATDSTCWSRVEGQVSWSLGDETLVGGREIEERERWRGKNGEVLELEAGEAG